MKTLIRSIFFTALIISAASCSDDEDPGATGVSSGATAILTDSQISVFDVSKDLAIEITGDAQVSGIEVFNGSTKIADATVSGNGATFNSSSLGALGSGSIGLDFVLSIAGGNFPSTVSAQTINVSKVISLTDEVSSIKIKDTASTNLIKYVTSTAGATIDDIVVTWRNGKAGMETDISTGFDTDEGTIDLKDRDYITDYGLTKGDTLIYSFSVSSGALTDKVEATIAIVPQPFNDESSGNLANNTTSNQLDLLTGTSFIDDAFSGDIDFVGPQGFGAINNTVDMENYAVDIAFVKLTDTGAAFYADYNDVEQAKVDFDAGVSATTIQVAKDDIIVYKIVRNTGTTAMPVLKDFYGSILVGDITIVNGMAVDMDLSSKENSIID
ncbi:hypothetical protein [Aquimarina algiphila]|uniref:hypothetical protein n=1 Tax=Aquimarina algiphila TaxID=2047982 RepID=UPI00232D5E46|nr:hypothetical protein [Aquimarina algiphila]